MLEDWVKTKKRNGKEFSHLLKKHLQRDFNIKAPTILISWKKSN